MFPPKFTNNFIKKAFKKSPLSPQASYLQANKQKTNNIGNHQIVKNDLLKMLCIIYKGYYYLNFSFTREVELSDIKQLYFTFIYLRINTSECEAYIYPSISFSENSFILNYMNDLQKMQFHECLFYCQKIFLHGGHLWENIIERATQGNSRLHFQRAFRVAAK